MLKSYFSNSPLPTRFFFYAGLGLSFILIARSYLLLDTTEYGFYGNINHSILTFWKYSLWPILVPGINYYLKKVLKQNKLLTKGGMLISAAIGIAVVHAIISNLAYYLTLWALIGTEAVLQLAPEFFDFIGWILANRLLDFAIIFGLLMGIDFYKIFSEKKLEVSLLRTELREAELEALRNQLKPHFLFNTLNTISSLIDQDTQKAQKVLSKIAHLLRTNLDHSRKEKITLQEELEVVRDYLEIESERFNDRLKVLYTIDERTEKAKVPNLLIQPLVENAFKHGVHKTIKMVELKVEAAIEEENLVLKIIDSGPIHNPKKSIGTKGVGLSNIKSRLKLLYGETAVISINHQDGREFEVMIKIPLEYES